MEEFSMKNLITKVNNIQTAAATRANAAFIKIATACNRVKMTMNNNNGDGLVDTAMKILISVVIGALIFVGLYSLFNDTIMPSVTKKIKDMFDLK
jgi:hypothetical protein